MTLILSGTDGLSDVDGSAATPAIRGTDTNTGIFFPAADTIAFSEGGVESMRLDSSGNVNVTAGRIRLGGGSDEGTQLNLWTTVGGDGTLAAFNILFNTGANNSRTERARIDSSGRWTVSNQPGFMAGIAATTDATVNANNLVPFNTVTQTNAFNTGTHFNTTTNLFTAPVAGRYFFSFTLYLTNSASSTASMQGGIRVNGAFISFTSGDSYGVAIAIPNSTGGFISTTTSVILNLSANDTVGVAARTNSIRIYQGHCFFTGYLLG